jgi:hypothetical protein
MGPPLETATLPEFPGPVFSQKWLAATGVRPHPAGLDGKELTTMDEAIRGSCVCGAVAFRIEGPFRGFQYCHCSRCRKKTGSSNVANIFVPVAQFAWERGESNVRRFELPSAKYWSTAFCTECGSAMPWLTRNGKAMVVGAGGLDDDPEITPAYSVFFGSRAPWYTHVSDLEMHETIPQS